MGEEEKSFFLHREAVSGISCTFWALNFRTKMLQWPDVRVDTFVSFAQFAYTGNYDVTRHEMDSESEPEADSESESEADSDSESERAVLLGHARLYALATNHEAFSLMKLALENIENALRQVVNYGGGWKDDVVELVEYAFHKPAEEGDRLQKLVLGFVMTNIKLIGNYERFFTMLENGGAFASSFWAEALQKIH